MNINPLNNFGNYYNPNNKSNKIDSKQLFDTKISFNKNTDGFESSVTLGEQSQMDFWDDYSKNLNDIVKSESGDVYWRYNSNKYGPALAFFDNVRALWRTLKDYI